MDPMAHPLESLMLEGYPQLAVISLVRVEDQLHGLTKRSWGKVEHFAVGVDGEPLTPRGFRLILRPTKQTGYVNVLSSENWPQLRVSRAFASVEDASNWTPDESVSIVGRIKIEIEAGQWDD